MKWKLFSRVWLFATPWTVQSKEFSRPEYWSGYSFPSPGYLPNPGTEPSLPHYSWILYQLRHKGSPKTLGFRNKKYEYDHLEFASENKHFLEQFVKPQSLKLLHHHPPKFWRQRIKKKKSHYLNKLLSVVTHLEPDILECEVKWALGSITTKLVEVMKFQLSYFKF